MNQPLDQTAFAPPVGAVAQVVLQRLVLPGAADDLHGLCLQGGRMVAGALHLSPDEVADFTSWQNAVDLAAWGGGCDLHSLGVQLWGQGEVEARLIHLTPAPKGGFTEATLARTRIPLSRHPVAVACPEPIPRHGILALQLRAIGPARLEGGSVVAQARLARRVRLALVITTFQREGAARASMARLSTLIGSGALGAGARLFVIDNGRSLGPVQLPGCRVIANRNLGGAGGFARGLAEARAGGFTHAIFMDDDATCPDEALLRSLALLSLARDPATAIAGAMIPTARPWQIWEWGAHFYGLCRPAHHGTDLRDRAAVVRMLLAGLGAQAGLYGGWWFFAFPLAAVRHDPFPFFLRGDDSGFCLSNGFHIKGLNGVAAIQEDFDTKQSPLTAYLDARYHLHHLLVQPGMRRMACWRVPLRLALRPLLAMHYDSAEAVLLALADVLRGPGHFLAHVDLGDRRARIATLTRAEVWRPDPTPAPQPMAGLPRWRRWACRLLLNGHLLPGWGRIAPQVDLPVEQRGGLAPVWGRSGLRYVDAAQGRAYVVRHDKRRFWRIFAGFLGLYARFLLCRGALRRACRSAYPAMTAPAFWQGQFERGHDDRLG